MPQHCISVMRAEWLKMSIFAPKKLCGRWTVNCSETRTTLILDRWAAYKKPTAQTAHLVFADTKANAKKTKRAIFYQRSDKRTDIKK